MNERTVMNPPQEQTNKENNDPSSSSSLLNISQSHNASFAQNKQQQPNRKLSHGRSNPNPRRSTFSSDAASSYYFSQVPKTPAVKSARKKYSKMNKMMNRTNTSISSTTDMNNLNLLFNASPSLNLQEEIMGEREKEQQKENHENNHDNDNDDDDTSMLLSDVNTTTTSSACSVSSASHGEDNLNKSVLSDTTELTASIFVFCEKSRRMKWDQLESHHQKDIQTLKQKKDDNKCGPSGPEEHLVEEDKQNEPERKVGDNVDVNDTQNDNKGGQDDEYGDDCNNSNDTERIGNLLHFEDGLESNEEEEEVEDLRDGCISRESESFNVSTLESLQDDKEDKKEDDDDCIPASLDELVTNSKNVPESMHNVEMEQENQQKEVDNDDDLMYEDVPDASCENEMVGQEDFTEKDAKSPAVAKDQSPVIAVSRQSIDIGSSSAAFLLPSAASPLPMPKSLPRNRRYSYIPESKTRLSLSGLSPQISGIFQRETESVKKLTASIQKARMMRESQKREKLKRNRFSLPSRFHSTFVGANEQNNAEQRTTNIQRSVDLNATFDETNHGGGLNQILGELVANNTEMNETMEHATPEKLNLSESQEKCSSPDPNRRVSSGDNPMLFKSPQFKRFSLGKPEREPVASPALNTRSKKRSSISRGESEAFFSLPIAKRSDRKSTPNQYMRNVQDVEGEDNTEMIMEYLVPRMDMDDSKSAAVATQMNESNAVMPNTVELKSVLPPVGSNLMNGGRGNLMEDTMVENVEHDASPCRETSEFSPPAGASQGNTVSSDSSTLVLSFTSSESAACSPQRMDASDPIPSENDEVAISAGENSSVHSGQGMIVENSMLSIRSRSSDSGQPHGDSHRPCDIEVDQCDSSTDTGVLLGDSVYDFREPNKSHEVFSQNVLSPMISSQNQKTKVPSSAKSNNQDTMSPLSGCENDDEGSDSDSSESCSSDDIPSKLDGDDGDTVGTAALREIMSDLKDDFMSSSKENSKKNRRRSSLFSTSSYSEAGSPGSEHMSRRAELFTANTQDLKGLLSDFTSRGSSLLPINESMHSVSTLLSPGNKDIEKIPMNKSIDSASTSVSPGNKEKEISPTSRTDTRTPKSILKKKGRESTPKRNVAFGPPVAAEYNIGSPAKNFTPLCSQTTKKLFSIPQFDNNATNLNQNNDTSQYSMELDTIHDNYQGDDYVKSPNESNANDDRTEGVTVALEANLGAMLQTIAGKDSGSPMLESDMDDSTAQYSADVSIDGGETMTLGLESDMKQLLERCYNQKELKTCTPPASKQVDQHEEMFDVEDTVRLESNVAEVLNIQENSLARKASPDLYTSNDTQHTGDGETISLEGDVNELFDSVHPSHGKTTVDRTLSKIEKSQIQSTEENDTLENTCDIESNTNKISKSPSTLSGEATMGDRRDALHTVELENDLQGMIGEMDRLESERLSIVRNNDDTISLTNISYVHKPDEDTVDYEQECNSSGKLEVPVQKTTLNPSVTYNMTSNRNDTIISNSEGFRQNDESYTMQLEDKMEFMIDAVRQGEDLLEGNVCKDKPFVGPSDISAVGSLANGRRRSRRFSLVPSTDISNEMTGNRLIDENMDTSMNRIVSDRKSLLSVNEDSDKDIRSISNKIRWEGLSLRWEEISQHFIHVEDSRHLESAFSFLLDGARSLLAEFSHPIIIDRVSKFLLEVCVLIENSDHVTNPDALLSKHLELKPSIYGCLKEAIKGESSHESMISHINLLKEIDSSAFDIELHEFSEWEVQVVSALCSKIEEVNIDVEDDEQMIMRQLNLSNDIHQTLSILSSQIVKNAREESIRRKKEEVEQLEICISSLEADIQLEEQNLLRNTRECADVETLMDIIKEKESLTGDLSRDRSFIDKNLEVITSLEGLQNWTLVQVEESMVGIEFIGDITEMCLSLRFHLLQNGEVICKANGLESTSQSRKQIKYTSSVKSFFKHQVLNLTESISKRPLEGLSEICSTIHHIDWYLGRLQLIGKELSLLEARYDGVLEKSNNNELYHFQLSILNNASGKVLNTAFEVGESYPFAFDVIISGDIDIIELEKHLTKSAKPGYGYLSRTCDIISSFNGR